MKRLTPEEHRSALQMPSIRQKFNGLAWVASALMAIAILVIILGVIGGALISSSGTGNLGVGLGVGLGSVIWGILIYAFGQLLLVQIAREYHERLTNELLLQLLNRQ